MTLASYREPLRVEEGALYPALHRMNEAGWIRSDWGVSENNRRARHYAITTAGRRRPPPPPDPTWEEFVAKEHV